MGRRGSYPDQASGKLGIFGKPAYRPLFQLGFDPSSPRSACERGPCPSGKAAVAPGLGRERVFPAGFEVLKRAARLAPVAVVKLRAVLVAFVRGLERSLVEERLGCGFARGAVLLLKLATPPQARSPFLPMDRLAAILRQRRATRAEAELCRRRARL